MKTGLMFFLFSVLLGVSNASAATIELYEWVFNAEGIVSEGYPSDTSDPLPVGMDGSGFSFDTGLGTLTWETSGAGNHSFIAFFDHDIYLDSDPVDPDSVTGTNFDESGSVSGTPATGQSWEIDEPGWVSGDIYDNVLAGALDNTNYFVTVSSDDVSMDMGWSFTLAADEAARITLELSESMPSGGFFLTQTDDTDPEAAIYFTGALDVRKIEGPQVPEPSTILLFGLGVLVLSGFQRKIEE